MGEYGKVAIAAAISWVVAAVLTAAWAKVPEESKQHPFLATGIISCFFAFAISLTTLLVYDRFFVSDTVRIPENSVVFLHEDARSCPDGYKEMGTILTMRYKTSPEPFITPGTESGKFAGNQDWNMDHMKLCLRK